MSSIYEIKRLGGRRFAVFQGERQVSTLSASMSMAEEKLAALEARDVRKGQRNRPCITCGDVFRSEGHHNRMCPNCRANASCVFEGAV